MKYDVGINWTFSPEETYGLLVHSRLVLIKNPIEIIKRHYDWV